MLQTELKKIVVTILTFVYLVAASGATLHMHYCMGEIYSVDFVAEEDCSKCGMEANEGCCHNEFKVVKVEDDHQAAVNDINSTSSFATVVSGFYVSHQLFSGATDRLALNNNSPPLSPANSLCILNCNFRL